MTEKSENSKLPDLSKLSHKQRKAYLKKIKRKAKRQEEAKKREATFGPEDDEEEEVVLTRRQIYEEEYNRKREQEFKEYAHQQWLEKERLAQLAFQAKKEWEEKEKVRLKEQEQRIREEWEEREKREKEEDEKRKAAEEERKTKQDKLLKEATAHENKDDGTWHNPLAPVRYGKERAIEKCPFFMKTGACRFGERCSRAHDRLDSSATILFPGMYAHFSLENALRDEYDTDIDLEYEDKDTYNHFEEFYNDVLPEFKKIGKVIQFKVCRNYEPHLRGNVFVQFENEADAVTAYQSFNARWYGGRQLQCEFCSVTNWKSAICGLYERKRCPKGKSCNFLHVFENPNREFFGADRGFNPQSERSQNFSQRGGNSHRRYSRSRSRSRDRKYSRSRDYSVSRDTRDYSRSRETRDYSRSQDHRDYSRSRDTRNYSRSRDIDSKSRDRYDSYSRDRGSSVRSDRHRSRSRERYSSRSRSNRYRSKSRDRERERSRDRHRSRSKDRHESKSLDRRPSEARSTREDNKTVSKNRDKSVDYAKSDLDANAYWSSSKADFDHDSVYRNDTDKNGNSDKLGANSEQNSDNSVESSVTNHSEHSKRHKKHKKYKKHKKHHSKELVDEKSV